MSEGVDARLKAIQALMPVVQQKASLTSNLPKAQQRLSTEDASLTQALAFGVCRFYTRLNFLAEQLLERPFKSKDLDVHLSITRRAGCRLRRHRHLRRGQQTFKKTLGKQLN